jgi:uncharacterized membrane protein HdeD (DUF308 family)
MEEKTSLGIKIFGIWYLIQGVIMFIDRIIVSIRRPNSLFIVVIFLGLLLFCIGIGLLKLKEWSRKASIYLNIWYLVFLYLYILVSVLHFGVKPYYKGIIIRLLLLVFVNIYFILPIYFFSRPITKRQFK